MTDCRRVWVGMVAGLLVLAGAQPAAAWGPQGHQTVGAIADRLLEGTRAGEEVRRLLAGEPLRVAALWADCAKNVTERPPHRYVENRRFPDCTAFESQAGESALVDYVARNLAACRPRPREESCHKQYHYADVAVQREAYRRGQVGTSSHDIVAALQSCIDVLQGRPASTPIDLRSREEALRLLAHLVGDLHQPLHVGAVYLDDAGRLLDPDRDGLREGSDTRGGNALLATRSQRLHGQWDAIPQRLRANDFAFNGARLARGIAPTAGPLRSWPVWRSVLGLGTVLRRCSGR